MYRNLTRAGSTSDARRKSSGGLLGNFPRKTSVVLNSMTRRGVGHPPDTSRSKDSIRHAGGGGGHDNNAHSAGGGGTGGSSGHNHTEKGGGPSNCHDGHHDEALGSSHGKSQANQVLETSLLHILTSFLPIFIHHQYSV